MKKLILVVFLMAVVLLSSNTAYAQTPSFLWVAQAGGADWDFGRDIATDDAGNSIVTGYFRDTATFGDTTLASTGDYALFVTKYDEAGDFLWAVAAGADGTDDVSGEGVATDLWGNIIVTGQFEGTAIFEDTTLTSAGGGDIFIAKYDGDGNFLWVVQAGGTDYEAGISVATDDSGNVIVTGEFWSTEPTFGGTTLINAGECDIFIAKLSAGVIGIDEELVSPFSLLLRQNFPNPFNSITNISFRIASASGGGLVSLRIYDVSGREVRKLVNECKQPGGYTVVWDGLSDAGVQVSSGVYFYRLEAGGFVETRKMLLIQ